MRNAESINFLILSFIASRELSIMLKSMNIKVVACNLSNIIPFGDK
jgi:hypothetical protein